ncbi:P-type cation-transporting ATPase [Paramyrothecium foliicola]|nr:P-type cation-transporting ATPase [Paramyrothecium foliicola]
MGLIPIRRLRSATQIAEKLVTCTSCFDTSKGYLGVTGNVYLLSALLSNIASSYTQFIDHRKQAADQGDQPRALFLSHDGDKPSSIDIELDGREYLALVKTGVRADVLYLTKLCDAFAGRQLKLNETAETINFLVSVMDCTTCADKLMRVFNSMAGVSQARVNFVMGNEEFTFDKSVTDASVVIKFASSASGFALSKLFEWDYVLDVLAPPSNTKRLMAIRPRGPTRVESIDKKTVRLVYDPALIGARDLYDRKDECRGLAEPVADPQLENSRRRLWDQLTKTLDEKTVAIISLVLGTLVQLITVLEFYRPALAALWYGRTVEMDMLVMASKPLEEGQFSETSTMLITFILVGRLIAAFARIQAIAVVSVWSRQNTKTLLVFKDDDLKIDTRLLQFGHRLKVLPHSRVPTDELIVSGNTEVDESMLTGESILVLKCEGDSLIAGTVNEASSVVAQLTHLPGKNTVTDIAQLVEESANWKPQIQDIANKVAGWFVPFMAFITVLLMVIWLACDIEVLGYGPGRAIGNAITYAVARLVVACPFTLGLAVPIVMVVAGGIAARRGIINKSAETTERARKSTDAVFDKTGTITADDGIALTKALIAGGKHPVSAAVEKFLEAEPSRQLHGVERIKVIPGAGIEARYDESIIRAGNSRWTISESVPQVLELQQAGLTTLVITKDSKPLIAFGLRVQLRPEAAQVIDQLKSRGITVHLVSGGQAVAVRAAAAAVGIPLENTVGESTPPEKRDYVARLMPDRTKYVLFCGDGTNDAIAVAQTNIGVQIGVGIPLLINISRSSYHRIMFNFVWSAIYNVLAVTMASGAWIKFRIPPRYAGLGERVSVVPVIVAAVSLFFSRSTTKPYGDLNSMPPQSFQLKNKVTEVSILFGLSSR